RGAPAAGAPADTVSPAWNHAMRYSGGASAVQLSLPAAADPEPAWAPESPGAEAWWAPPAAPRGAAPDPWEGEDLAQVTPPDAEPTPASPRPVSRPASAVGYVAAALAPGESCAYLQALVVAPSHRRQGIAGRLLAQACRWAAGQGAVRLMADVSARNYPALRLLEKAGFSFCGYNDRCYPKNEVAIFLSIDL
ncbi:MAG TPA: GNAT family N-acetyltransferase, partial [Chloroflexota bacterium]|nr:GNAT family N-acetyltransferase [Chloroflexota bacterium]